MPGCLRHERYHRTNVREIGRTSHHELLEVQIDVEDEKLKYS